MPPQPVITPLSASATAYLQLPGGWFLNNAGWIAGRDRTLLVDTCATEARSQQLLDAARTAGAPGAPMSAVITHWHGDHANGAALVARSGGAVLTSAAAAKDIASGPHTFPAMFTCSTWGDIRPPAATEIVTQPCTVDLGGPQVEILPVSGSAHTEGDLVVWLEREGVLFAGDLVFSGVTPLAISGSVLGWLDALAWLESFEARRIVPGHGPIATAESPALTELRDYLRWLLDVVDADDEPDFAALERQACTKWSRWLESERHAVNLRIAHAEIRRHTLDLNSAMQAMLRAAGGPITLDL